MAAKKVNVEIREIRQDEYDFLFDMLHEAIFVPEGEEKLPESVVHEPYLSKYVKNFGKNGDLAFVLVKDGQLIGAVWARLLCGEEKGYGFVDENTPELSMAIKADFRGRGFGTRLLEKIFERFQSDGVKKISLSVDKLNAAVRLYQRHGFEIAGEKGTAYTMLKRL